LPRWIELVKRRDSGADGGRSQNATTTTGYICLNRNFSWKVNQMLRQQATVSLRPFREQIANIGRKGLRTGAKWH
jgi:hypothetical protein